MIANKMVLCNGGEAGAFYSAVPSGRRVSPVITVGSANDISISIKVSADETGDLFADADTGIMSVWNGAAWDDIGLFSNLQMTKTMPVEPQLANRPCPSCGTLNPPDAIECGEGRWNGCGAPLREQ